MELDARGLLLGAGLFGMVVGATLGMVAGAEWRACEASFATVDAPAVCDGYATLRTASFALVGLSALTALLPIVGMLRAGGGLRLVWRR